MINNFNLIEEIKEQLKNTTREQLDEAMKLTDEVEKEKKKRKNRMFSEEETKKIIEFNKLEKQYEKLYEEVGTIIEKKYNDFECGDRIGNIVSKEEIPETAQKNEDGTYTIYHQTGEDWGNGIVYLPLNNEYGEFVEIYYST